MIPLSNHITQFLIEFKRIAEIQGIHIIPRPAYQETIVKLELTRKNVDEILLGLSDRDYVKGPMEDRDRPDSGKLYVFGNKLMVLIFI